MSQRDNGNCGSTALPQVLPNFSNVLICCRIKKPRQNDILNSNINSNITNASNQNRNEINQQSVKSNGSSRKQNPIKSPKTTSYKSFSQIKSRSGSLSASNRSLSMQKRDSNSGIQTPKRSTSQNKKHQSSLLENFEYSIFTPIEETPFVIASEESTVKGKAINSFLVSQNDIGRFTNEYITQGNQAQLFIFDKVINESHTNQSLYSKLIRGEIHSIAKNQGLQNFCCILFGPTDQNEKSSKLSQLLTTKSDGNNSNIALKSIHDILTIQETIHKQQNIKVGVQIIQIYCTEAHDLLINDTHKQSNKISIKESTKDKQIQFNVQSSTKTIKNVQDFCQLLRVAQQNRNMISQQLKIESNEMKNRSHLIIRVVNGSQTFDFVELCGSEIAASTAQSYLVGKQVEILRKFATTSFNSMSMLLTMQSSQMKEHTLLSQVLYDSITQPKTKVLLCCQVSPAQYLFRHSVTAIKFSSKIREVIVKKHIKEGKNMVNISNELHNMSQKILEDPHIASNKELINQFNNLRSKYEDIMSQSKSFGAILKDQDKFQKLERIRNEFNCLKDEFNIFEVNHLNDNDSAQQHKDKLHKQHQIYDSFNKVQRIDSSRISHQENSSQKKSNNIAPQPHNFDSNRKNPMRNSHQSDNLSLNKNSDSFTNQSITNILMPTPEFKNQRFPPDSFNKHNYESHFNQQSNIIINSNSPSLDREYERIEMDADDNHLGNSVNIDNEDFSLNITVSENTNIVGVGNGGNANHSQNHSYNITHSSSQNRLTQESQKLLEKYREAKRQKQERDNSLNHSNNNLHVLNNYSKPIHKSSSNGSFELKKNMSYELSNTNITSKEYIMTEDIKIGKLQLEIQMLKEQLNEKTTETQTLKQALFQIKNEETQQQPYINRKYQNLDLAHDLDESNDPLKQIQDLEGKLDCKNEQIAQMLRTKQQDQKELNELRFKFDREASHSQKIQAENESLKTRIEQMQKRFIDQERLIETQKMEIKNLTQQNKNLDQTQTAKEMQLKKIQEQWTENDKNGRQTQAQVDEMKSEMYDMKLELETLKRQKNILQNQYEDTKQESQQLLNLVKAKDSHINDLEEELTSMKANEYDKVNFIHKQSEFDVKLLNVQHQLQQALKDKKKADDDLFIARDKLREILGEKISIENQLNHIERVEGSRINELEMKYDQLNREYQQTLEQNKHLVSKEVDLRKEIQVLQKGRDSFKEQFLELREFNKDLKNRFVEIERQVSECIVEDRKKENYDKENQKNENKKKEYILQDIQGLIKDYKKNARDKKSRYAFNPIIDSTNDTSFQ